MIYVVFKSNALCRNGPQMYRNEGFPEYLRNNENAHMYIHMQVRMHIHYILFPYHIMQVYYKASPK